MLTSREQNLERKRQEMADNDVKQQKAAQFALDVSKHIGDSKQKEFWRQSQLAAKEGVAAGQLGQESPAETYANPAVAESAGVGHLEGMAAQRSNKAAAEQKALLELLRIGGRKEVEGVKHGYRSDELGIKGEIRGQLQEDQQAHGVGIEHIRGKYAQGRADTMAGSANSRAAVNRDQQAKEMAVKFYIERAKQQGPMGRIINPQLAAEIDATAESLLPLAQDPSISPQEFNDFLRKVLEQKASGSGGGMPSAPPGSGAYDPSAGPDQFGP